MSKQGRILVVEDREDWRKALVEELQRAHFYADAAKNIEDARQLLASAVYHVLILDIRLNDSDTSNTDGLKLLQELEEQGMTEEIRVIMLSAFGTKDHMRKSFRDYNVADFVFKTRFNHQTFVEDVKRVFTRKVCINLDLGIHWSAISGPEPIVVDIKLNLGSDVRTTRVQAGSALQRRIASEVDDLMRRLFYEAQSILVKPMPSGRSGTVVLEVRPFYADGGGSPMVVKFGDAHKVLQEYNNFKEYIERLVGGRRCTGVHGLRHTALLGGLIYSFVGAGDQLEDFGSFYRRSEPVQITQALDQLFLKTCIGWYANASHLQLLDLAKDYQRILHFTSEKLEDSLRQLSTVQRVNPDYLYFEALPHQQPFKNPLHPVVEKPLAFPTYTSPTHGDFNHHNLLVDNDGHIWMIDFQGTGQGHFLRDIVALDSVIRFQLLTASDATLEEFLEMEQALCSISHFSQVNQLAGTFHTNNPALVKAHAIVVHLRTLACRLVKQNPSDDFNEYYAALLYNALNTMRFKTLEQEQRERALLSTCLLAKQLGLID